MSGAEILPMPDLRRRRLKELEEVIAHGWDAVVEVGRALREIRDEGLYLELDGGLTFEQYVKSRWSMAKRTAYYRIDAADIDEAVHQGAHGVPISTERVARELAPILKEGGPKLVAEAWSKVSARYEGQRPPTAREVNKALIEDGYRERMIGPSSGRINRTVRLGMFGDKLKAAERRFDWFLTKELGRKPLAGRELEMAAEYAEIAKAMAATLRKLAAGEVLPE